MTNPIVQINISQQQAPTPSKLQKSGALISQGATNTSPGTLTLLTRASGLTAILNGALALTSISWSGNVATATTAAPHGLPNTETMVATIAGATPAGYNGTFLITITGASTFTYALLTNPGGSTSVPGTYTLEDVAELNAMVTSFFGQGTAQAVWVLELGPGDVAAGVTFLTSWIGLNPNTFYGFLVPRFWDGNTSFLALLQTFNGLAAKTYFFITTTLQNWHLYPSTDKCALALIEAPSYGKWSANALTAISYSGGTVTGTTTTAHGVVAGQYFSISGVTPSGYNGTFLALQGTTGSTLKYALAADPGAESVLGTLVASLYTSSGVPATEFSMAAVFQVALNYAPNPTNRMTTLNLAYLFGVTAFPTQGNAALLSTLNAANINVVGTGAAGGISSTILVGGSNLDGHPFRYWYSVDWAQITVSQNVNAALINGSNNPQNPIDYNQNGINALQQVAATTMSQGVSSGLVLNPVKQTTLTADEYNAALDNETFGATTLVNAVPFASYVALNPNDYGDGIYDGFSINYTPLIGFEEITFNINVSSFAG